MEVFLEKISATDYDDKPYEFRIHGRLKSGKIINIFDDELFDLRKYENKLVKCLILAFLIKPINFSKNINNQNNNLSELKRQNKNHLIKIFQGKSNKIITKKKITIIHGKFINNYYISDKSLFNRNKSALNKNLLNTKIYDNKTAIETIDGIFLLEKEDLKSYSFKEGEEIALDVGRFDLLGWHPIKKI